MIERKLNRPLGAVSILLHILALILLMASTAIIVLATRTGGPDYAYDLLNVVRQPRFFNVVVLPDATLSIAKGWRRQKIIMGGGIDSQEVFKWTYRSGYSQFELISMYRRKDADGRVTPAGEPILEYTKILIHWSFFALVGVFLLTISLLPPGGRTVRRGYANLLSKMSRTTAILLGRGPKRRGFDVLPRKPRLFNDESETGV